MRIYLAARYSRHPEMFEYAQTIERETHHKVVASWITGAHEDKSKSREFYAIEDAKEVAECGLLISFTEEPGSRKGRGRGGRHVEFGMAVALRKNVWVIGPRENVFHELPEVLRFSTFDDALMLLRDVP